MITTVVAAVFVLGVLIFVHELGHFLLAKKAGVRVERFSLGYPPKMVGKKIGDTEYCISWVPLGGYVKLAGENPDRSQLRGKPWEFQLKPVWQRALVVVAGPGMNFLLAILIFWMMIFMAGAIVVNTTRIGAVAMESPAEKAGLQAGDRILSVDGKPVSKWNDIFENLSKAKSDAPVLEVDRGGRLLHISLPRMEAKGPQIGISPFLGTEIGSVIEGSPASKAGLRVGDRVVTVDGKPVEQWDQMAEIIHAKPAMPVHVKWLRDEKRFEAEIVTTTRQTVDEEGRLKEVGMIGIGLKIHREKVGPLKSFISGLSQTYRITELIVSFVKKLILGQASTKLLGGPVLIAQMAGEVARSGFGNFLTLLALLSINLGLLNILPIPVLDGGHLLLLSIEGISRKSPSLKQREILYRIGLAFLILLMIYVTYNDLARIF